MRKIILLAMVLSVLPALVCAQASSSGMGRAYDGAVIKGLKQIFHPQVKEQPADPEEEAFVQNVHALAKIVSSQKKERAELQAKIEKYLQDGGNINGTDKYGNTALHWIVVFNDKDTLEMLLQYDGVDIYRQNGKGLSPVDILRRNRNYKMLCMLETYEKQRAAQNN